MYSSTSLGARLAEFVNLVRKPPYLQVSGRNTGTIYFTPQISEFRLNASAAPFPDFLFEAIKSEREGTPRQYLEAAEALALSPVEFFHANNFSMKFVAPVLLGAARGGGGGGGGSIIAFAEAPCGRAGLDIDRDDEVRIFCWF